jgi:hypothetical protein
VPRRVSLPGADELFRTTGAAVAPVRVSPPVEPPPHALPPAAHTAEWVSERLRALPTVPPDPEPRAPGRAPGPRPLRQSAPRRGGSGRTWHDEKITVYVSSQELLALEHARLVLRAEHGIAVDRGRIVREAIAELLADLDARGEESLVVRRLQRR